MLRRARVLSDMAGAASAEKLTATSDDAAGEETRAVPKVTDYYLSWLCWANAGMLWRANVDRFEPVIRLLLKDNAEIVNIELFCGKFGLHVSKITR
jgi:hypothetical protein